MFRSGRKTASQSSHGLPRGEWVLFLLVTTDQVGQRAGPKKGFVSAVALTLHAAKWGIAKCSPRYSKITHKGNQLFDVPIPIVPLLAGEGLRRRLGDAVCKHKRRFASSHSDRGNCSGGRSASMTRAHVSLALHRGSSTIDPSHRTLTTSARLYGHEGRSEKRNGSGQQKASSPTVSLVPLRNGWKGVWRY